MKNFNSSKKKRWPQGALGDSWRLFDMESKGIQLKADALNKEISVVKMEEAVSFGALKASYSHFDYEIDYQIVQADPNQVQAFDRLLDKYSYLYESKRFLVDDNFHQSYFESKEVQNRCTEAKEIFFSWK